MDQAVNMDGWVDVSSLTSEAGSIVLHAAQGTADVGGQVACRQRRWARAAGCK